jgi:hypothetical protein
MIDPETADCALDSLYSSILALIEHSHSELVLERSPDRVRRLVRAATIRQLGVDLEALATALIVLIRTRDDS